jgi:ATP/maltotriose-dependent transcriptional regulator MalT
MVQPADQLIGRAAELDALHHALAQLERRRSAALELVGEPGIGKTRLLAELGREADLRGHVVLSGSASELERDLPFWVFVDALDDYLRGMEPRRLDSLDDEVRSELANVFPSLAGSDGRATRAAGDGRYRTQLAVRDLLEAMAATKPVVLMLDDLHWADSGSIELLGALLRRPPSGAVLLAIAFRPRQAPTRLLPALDRAERAGSLAGIEVGALDADEARQLLGGSVDHATAAWLYEASGGNPFYLLQLARSTRRPGQEISAADDVAFAGVEVPRPVAAAMTEELALLPDEMRRALEGAAVAGDPFEPELAAAAADLSETAVVEALDELLARDLVRHTDTPRRFRFRHPLVRRAVYEGAPGGWRLGAHERTATLLASRGASATARAHHVERSARYGDTAAIALLREAGAQAMGRAPATAAHLLEAALRLLPTTAPASKRADLLALLGGAHSAAGQFYEAHAALVESINLLPADAIAARVSLTARCAGLENLIGQHADAHNRLLKALDALEDKPSAAAGTLMAELSADAFYRIEYSEMRARAERGLGVAHALGDDHAIATAAGLSAFGAVLSGDVEGARAHVVEAAAVVDAMSDSELAHDLLSRSVGPLAATALYLERLDDAARFAERALAVARATGQGQVLPILFWSGVIRAVRGELAGAAELFDVAIEIARSTGHAEGIVWNLVGRSQTAAGGGDFETALTAAEEADALSRRSEPSFLSTWAGVALAGPLLATGSANRAADVLLAAGGGADLPQFPAPWLAGGFELLAGCRLAQGRLDEARSAATAAQAVAERLGLAMQHAVADRASAAVMLAADQADAAAELALSSADGATQVGSPIDAAAARVLAGRALAAAGRREEAVEQLERGASAFEAHGALRHRDAAERELGKLGRRRHRRTRAGNQDGSGIETLTERELEVAWLVVDRKTNAQIAGELFLSEKTVESHIRHLFQKLGVSSRVDVARTVERAAREGVASR